MNPTEDQIERIPEPFSEPQTIPAGWDVSAFDDQENGSGSHHGNKDQASQLKSKSSKKRHDSTSNAL
jgi:hypothetical protein